MRTPSRKSIDRLYYLTPEKKEELYKLLKGTTSPDTYKSVQAWSKECYNEPSRLEKIMEAADEILETHGVEAIQVDYDIDSYHLNCRYTYCNTGDTYSATVVYDAKEDRISIQSMGDIVENDSKVI